MAAQLNVGQLATAIIGAMKGSFDHNWPKIKEYAEGEGTKLAQTLVQIEALRIAHEISPGEAAALFEMQKNTARSVLLALQGMGLIAVEMAINAAIDAVRGIVNTALGFTLL